MAQPGFIFGKGTPDTYESLQAKRKTAERLGVAAMRTPSNVGEGFASLGQAIAYRRLMNQADTGDAAGRAAYENGPRASALAALFGGSLGGGPRVSSSGTWTPDAPAPKPTDLPGMGAGLSYGSTSRTVDTPAGKRSVTGAPIPGMPQIGGGGLDFGSATMTPQEMLIAGAEARGLNPIDVATAISYETGGKFDPMISGPTTQWGTHQGLIQFGEPQAAEHGADFSDPNTAMRSQLDPTSGAVWSYLDKSGVKPGMGLEDVYSAINAGAPGRYGASDANNGGAPGTVGDKVAGMGDHRGVAADWLGGTWTPGDNVTVSTQGAPAQGGGPNIPAILEAMSNPYATDADRSVFGMLLQQQLTAMQPQSESERLDLLLKQAELDQIQNPAVDPMDAVALAQAELNLEQDRNPGKKDPINVNNVLLDPDTFQPVYDGREAERPETKTVKLADGSDALVQYNKETGAWDPAKVPEGGTGAQPNGKLTEAQSKTTLFKSMQDEVTPFLDGLEQQWDPANLADAAARATPIAGNFLQTEEGQQYTAAASMWAEGALRISTGAAATEPEIQRNLRTYFAQPGDTPATVQFKKQLRSAYERSIRRALGEKNVDGSIPLPTPTEFAAGKTPPPDPAANPVAVTPAPPAFLSNPIIQKAARDAGVSEQDVYDAMSPEARTKYGASQ
jgi:hypothetical protein